MEKIFNLEDNELNMRDVLYERLKKQRLEDLAVVNQKYVGGELEDKIDQVERDFDFNLEKLDFIPELAGRDAMIQRKFTEMALYIDDMDINKGNSLDAILTFGTVISKVPTHVELLDNESAFILSTAMTSLSLSDYESHGQIVSNSILLESVKAKSSDMGDRRNMLYDMFDYCDEVAYEDMSQEEYKKAISDCIGIVNGYEIQNPTKTK